MDIAIINDNSWGFLCGTKGDVISLDLSNITTPAIKF